ncbi:MAG: rhomboid family intramembrane serine protease [Hyphomicrobiales bacterium]|nr:rhomboid family intramembrane serine protease [Hyphomicrobiales bacterium]
MQKENDAVNPPIFNIPRVAVIIMFLIAVFHVIRVWIVPDQYDQDFILLFAAIPARYSDLGGLLPYPFAAWYTPLTHAFVHADLGHLLINLAWMLAFGSPVALRFGPARYLALFCFSALVAFAFHLITHQKGFGPMIGASGAVSAFMGAAIRLQRDVKKPVLPLTESFKNRGFLAFVGVWFAINYLIGMEPGLVTGEDTQIAWEAHIGGFLTGLLLFKFFDPMVPENSN